MKRLALVLTLLWLVWTGRPLPPQVTFLNVGQGLAVLYQHPSGFTMLYDAGPERAVASELGQTLPPWQRTIDLVIISHAHADHIEGLLAVLDGYDVRELWLPHLADSQLGHAIKEKIAARPQIIVAERQTGDWRVLPGGDTLALWHPAGLGREKHAGTQVVALENLDGQRLLLTGDLDAADEAAALAYCQARRTCSADRTILQVSHHGSKTSTTNEWLEAIQPNLAVISVGENSYGHPAPDVLERLRQLGISTKRTDLDGRVLTPLAQRR